MFALAAPAFALATVALATVLVEPARSGPPASLAEKYRELGALAVRRELVLPYAACCTVLLSFVRLVRRSRSAVLETLFGLDESNVLLVRLAGLPAMALAPFAGWLVGRIGAQRVAVRRLRTRCSGLASLAVTVSVLWGLVLGLCGLAKFVGGARRAAAATDQRITEGPFAAGLPLEFAGLLLGSPHCSLVGRH